MERLFEQQTRKLEQTANALGQHITRTSKNTTEHLEATVRLQQSLGSNRTTLQYQGQKLSPGIALQLQHQLEGNSYDLVLDLGAGVTTLFLAGQLQTSHEARKQRLLNSRQQDETTETLVEGGDVPKRILAFTSHRNDCNELGECLSQQGLEPMVGLYHAPLIDCPYGPRRGLYYDLDKSLARIAELYELRVARLLVVINRDQQPDNLASDAALPVLLQHLGRHQLDIFMFPQARGPRSSAPGATVTQWEELLDERGIEYQVRESAEVGDAQIMRINP